MHKKKNAKYEWTTALANKQSISVFKVLGYCVQNKCSTGSFNKLSRGKISQYSQTAQRMLTSNPCLNLRRGRKATVEMSGWEFETVSMFFISSSWSGKNNAWLTEYHQRTQVLLLHGQESTSCMFFFKLVWQVVWCQQRQWFLWHPEE